MPDLGAVYITLFSTENFLAFHLHENAVAKKHWTPLTLDLLREKKSFLFHWRKIKIQVWND